ncbi:hypothetical protein BFF78_00235 [Streptomyces fodineus]|uniref:Uncharacterized protein n=1 Tax=Streptomyces fodineus TaxID=1904616 RepID=A0A1D7Y2Q2_9ACTN|nr:hypothetical protein BFF78_00235 [Streptomyces fodineus]
MRGAVLTWFSLPEGERDPALLTAMRESMVAAVTHQQPALQGAGPADAARTLRALLPEQTALSDAEPGGRDSTVRLTGSGHSGISLCLDDDAKGWSTGEVTFCSGLISRVLDDVLTG